MEFDDSGYTPADDSPEAQLYRRQQRAEERAHQFREGRVEELLASLRPGDARLWMPTLAQILRFNLRHDKWD